LNIEELTNAALEVLRLLNDYSTAPHREMLIDPALYAYLEGRFGSMEILSRVVDRRPATPLANLDWNELLGVCCNRLLGGVSAPAGQEAEKEPERQKDSD
jgi:hypothetical protein